MSASAPRVRKHYYLSVLGSCASGDSFRTTGWPSFVDGGLRVQSYVGRTGFLSLRTPGLADSEWAHSEAFDDAAPALWGYQMALGELRKDHAANLLRTVRGADALVLDVVSMFSFPHLFTEGDGRVFLQSWEAEKYFRVLPAVRARWLWEIEYEACRVAAVEFLGALVAQKPGLKIAFHAAPACTNDGVRFKVDVLNDHVRDYEVFCERFSQDLERAFPGASTLQGERAHWAANPKHPYGRFPFHYQVDYYVAFRRVVKRWLGLPDEAQIAPEDNG